MRVTMIRRLAYTLKYHELSRVLIMSCVPCSSTLVRSFKALQWTTAESFQPRALINSHTCPPQLSSSHVDPRALISSTGARTSTDRSCRAHSFVWCAVVNSRAVPIKLESKRLEYNFEGILITLVMLYMYYNLFLV